MNIVARLFAASAACLMLTACGGGGVNSTPAPAPSPAPTPTPSPAPPQTIADLQTNQTFATNNASVDATFNLDSKEVVDASSKTATLTVEFNAASKTYTVSVHGLSQSFAPGAAQSSSQSGETRFEVTSGSTKDFLTLVTTPYSGGSPNKYVGLGYWQRAQISGSIQTNTVDMFVYGFDTPGADVPRTGSLSYATDAFGLLTWPGEEPMVVSGSGTFDVDLKTGAFSSSALVGEYSLASWDYTIGGLLVLQSAGTIGSGNGFSGNFSFTDLRGTIGGKLDGRFFGPAAQEVGASFSGQNPAGATITGGMTGQQNPNATPRSLTLGNIVSETALPAHFVEFGALKDTSQTPALQDAYGALFGEAGTVTMRPDGSATVRPLTSHFGEVLLNDASRSSVQKANYDSYDVTLAATPTNEEAAVHVDLAKRGSANGLIALTYAGFGSWTQSSVSETSSDTRSNFFVYGFETPQNMLAGRTGNATYSGIVQGVSASADGALQDVGGTSSFNVDFSNQTYSGSLVLSAQTSQGSLALGTWTFMDALARGLFNPADLQQSGVSQPQWLASYNTIQPHFYGPFGQEVAAPFSILTGERGAPDTLAVAGVAIAKQN
jgi:hypothetical protein